MSPIKESTTLPLAANRAALSNRISLLLSSQSSVLKSMNLQPRPTTATTKRTHIDDEDDFLKGTRPNEGVGYIPDKKAAPVGNAKEDRVLRGGLKGKGKDNWKSKWKEESESEEEVGRSALGKRKRPRRVASEAGDKIEKLVEVVIAETKEKDTQMGDTPNETSETVETEDVADSAAGEKKKRKKKKNKSKNKNQGASE